MDFVNKLTGGQNNSSQASQPQGSGHKSSGGGFMDKINNMAGGGRESEKNEDVLDKGESETLGSSCSAS
jgi:hypothetical protein